MHSLYFKINRKSRDACNTPPGGAGQTSTCKILKLICAQLDTVDQPTPLLPRSASHSP